MKWLTVILLLLSSTISNAQEQIQSTAPDRIALQFGQLFIQSEQQKDQIIALQQQLQQANAEIKRFKELYEPNKKDK